MRILIASSGSPFTSDDAIRRRELLFQVLSAVPLQVDWMQVPYWLDLPSTMRQLLSIRLLDVTAAADKLITLSPSTHWLRHRDKTVWLFGDEPLLSQELAAAQTQGEKSDRKVVSHLSRLRNAETLMLNEARRVICSSPLFARGPSLAEHRGVSVVTEANLEQAMSDRQSLGQLLRSLGCEEPAGSLQVVTKRMELRGVAA